MSTYSPFQIFCIVFCGIGVLLGPMVMDGTRLHAGSSEFTPDPGGVIVTMLAAVAVLPASEARGTLVMLLGAVTVLPASENSGTRAREEGGGNGLLATLPRFGSPELLLAPPVPGGDVVVGGECRCDWIAAWILVSTLESTACIEEATAVCTDCETMDVSAAIPAEGEAGGPVELRAVVVVGGAVDPSGVAIRRVENFTKLTPTTVSLALARGWLQVRAHALTPTRPPSTPQLTTFNDNIKLQ